MPRARSKASQPHRRDSRRRALRRGGGCLLAALTLVLTSTGTALALPDGRGWELVTPVEKNGGQVGPPGSIAGGGVLQAVANGGALTYSARASFGTDPAGAPLASQYLARRGAAGWSTDNLTAPIFSGTYDLSDQGVPYQIFSSDLARAFVLNGDHCRGEAEGCAVANPPLPGTDAPAGYQNYYLWEAGTFEAILGSADIAGRGLDPATFDLRLVGVAPDLRTAVFASCSALASNATDGCGEGKGNLYRRGPDGGLTSLNATPGAELAAPAGAISTDGSRIYWQDQVTDNLYVRDGNTTRQVDAGAGGGGTFEAASTDGATAYYSKAGNLWRYQTASDTSAQIASGIEGVLAASSNGDRVYFQDAAGLQYWMGGSVHEIAPGAAAADPSTYPAATGRARVSNDGSRLLFVSDEELTGYQNLDKVTGQPDSQVFLFDAAPDTLRCVSCNPTGKRPIGPSTIPGAIANGGAPGSVQAYKPRALSANGRRVFFDSADTLVSTDSNALPATGTGVADAYQWEAQGEGDCIRSGGCVALLSNGALPSGASFADASADGADAYFLTAGSLLPSDPGSMDLYDARVGGGFAEPAPPIPCEADACQILPSAPTDPTVTTLLAGAGNPPVTYHKYCRKGYVKRKGICVKRSGKRSHRNRRHHRGDR